MKDWKTEYKIARMMVWVLLCLFLLMVFLFVQCSSEQWGACRIFRTVKDPHSVFRYCVHGKTRDECKHMNKDDKIMETETFWQPATRCIEAGYKTKCKAGYAYTEQDCFWGVE